MPSAPPTALLDTPEWRDANRVDYHAPKPHEKSAPDNDLFKAIRAFPDTGMGPVEAALAAGADVNAQDKVRAHTLSRLSSRARPVACG